MTDLKDIIIIGGGINGAGIAADAANRGLSVLLCEKDDLANATSSSSTKLVHGGLRYLEHYEFLMVRKSLKEREVVLNMAPHISHPLEFILPHADHLRPAFLIRMGLFLYDHLAKRIKLPASKRINCHKDYIDCPLKPNYQTGFSYYDGWVDDARLVVLNAMAAQQNGADIQTQTECINAIRHSDHWEVELFNHKTQTKQRVKAKALVNAAGPWVNDVLEKKLSLKTNKTMQWVKGSHIIVPKVYQGDHAYILQNPDKRIVFAIPYEDNYTLIGTTDVPYHDDLNQVEITQEEIDYLCKSTDAYFKTNINPQTITWTYSGVRPLFGGNSENPSELTRDYELELDTQSAPLLTIYGGKITTFRTLAEQAVDRLKSLFPQMKAVSTKDTILPGGNIENDFETKLNSQFPWLGESLVNRYTKLYGTLCFKFLEDKQSLNDMGDHFGAGLYAAEVDYLVKHEWATTAEDILWRRTKLGLCLNQVQTKQLKEYLQQ